MSGFLVAIFGGISFAFGYGVSDFFAKKSMEKVSNLGALFYMQLIGLFLIPLYLIYDPTFPEITLAVVVSVAGFAALYAGANLMLYKAFDVGKVSVVSPIASSYSIGVAIASFLFFGESMPAMKVLFVIVVAIGAILISFDIRDLKNGVEFKDMSRGVIYVIPNFFILAFMYPLLDRFLDTEGWAVLLIMMRAFIVGFLVLLMLIKKENFFSKSAGSVKYWIIGVALFEVLGFFGSSWAYAISEGSTSVITSIGSLFPLVTGIMAFIFLKERLAVNQYLGALIIIAGLVLLPLI